LVVYGLKEWCEVNKEEFLPPVCAKLMHKDDLSIMFVGGPNVRTDFHVEEGSEFFYMVKGDMLLPTIQRGKKVEVSIKEGEVFLLPSRIPHSPQRVADTLGLVIERRRTTDESDCLRWYTDQNCTQIMWEKYFYCDDLGRDLVPVVKEYYSLKDSLVPGQYVCDNPPLKQDVDTEVPAPFNLHKWIDEHRGELYDGKTLNLFPGHPDKEFEILIAGHGKSDNHSDIETWLYQLHGNISLTIDGQTTQLKAGECLIIPANKHYSVHREPQSIGMIAKQNPKGNKKN